MLLDSSVLIASAVMDHPHHEDASAALDRGSRFTVAAPSLAELYNTLSKPRIYGWPPRAASLAVAEAGRRCSVVALTPNELAEGIVAFAAIGGVGARLYDYLIGYHAVVHSIGTIVTLNDRDFHALFPRMTVLTPTQFLESL